MPKCPPIKNPEINTLSTRKLAWPISAIFYDSKTTLFDWSWTWKQAAARLVEKYHRKADQVRVKAVEERDEPRNNDQADEPMTVLRPKFEAPSTNRGRSSSA